MGRISVKNGGPSRKGEKRKTPQTNESRNRYAGSRQIENRKMSTKRKVANAELSKEGLYTCTRCYKVKPKEDFPQHVPTSQKWQKLSFHGTRVAHSCGTAARVRSACGLGCACHHYTMERLSK